MFCHQCGEQIPEEANFCNKCGEKVIREDNQAQEQPEPEEKEHGPAKETIVPAEEEPGDRQLRSISKKKHSLKKAVVLLPVISLLLAGGGVSGYYFYEMNKNEQVLALEVSAEKLAGKGDYEKAAAELKKAQNVRPDYPALKQELELVTRADRYTDELTAIDKKIKQQEFNQAREDLAATKESVEKEGDPLFTPFPELIAAKEVTIAVGAVKQELNDLATVSALAEKLDILETLEAKEAEAVKKQILTKVVKLTADKATVELEEKQFAEASATIEEGLQHAKEDKQLLSLKEKVVEEQTAFEQAEQERLEAAMEAAAKEDLHNKTAAVQLDSFDVSVDDYGDLYINGQVTSAATKEISSVTIYYAVSDLAGNHLYDDSTTVYPYYLSPDETGTFEDVIYYVEEDVEVEVTNITWYIQ